MNATLAGPRPRAGLFGAQQVIDKLPMFAALTRAQREALLKCAYTVERKAGAALFHEGDPAGDFYILLRGRVKMRKISSTGHEVILDLATSPHMIGCKALTRPGSTYPADAIAIEDTAALRFSRDRFIKVVAEVPDVFFTMLVNMNMRLSEIYTLKAALMEPVELRIATLLLQQALPVNADPENWHQYPISEVKLTKTLIAAIVGTTTETTIRILSRWRKRGLISSERGLTRVLRPDAILEISRGSQTDARAKVLSACDKCKQSERDISI